jgi:hypothetical protein
LEVWLIGILLPFHSTGAKGLQVPISAPSVEAMSYSAVASLRQVGLDRGKMTGRSASPEIDRIIINPRYSWWPSIHNTDLFDR